MEKAFLVMGMALLICSFSSAASAQRCGGQNGGTIGSCYSNNCYGQYEQLPPPGDATPWMKVTVHCCSQEVELWIDEQQVCFSELTQNDKKSIRLLAGMGIPLMVRDCKGHFTQIWTAKV